MDPDAAEIRVLGCLIEKQRTTPDTYPRTLNALRAACNQSTNREPVVAYDEETIRDGLDRLAGAAGGGQGILRRDAASTTKFFVSGSAGASAATSEVKFACVSMTPFGLPVVPLV